nr:endogenous retrovirus group K member 8 Gag polyprotein-like [Dasypus novemcinctus]XP_058143513.1 endogenous retrovirus group K member 8 Gag polyprotein-like [Dasypus novemcinctus]
MKELRRAYQKGENIPVSVWALGQHIAAALDPLQSDEEDEIVLFSREETAMNDIGKDRNLEEDQEEKELFEVKGTNPFLTKSMSELNISKVNIYPNLTHEVPSAPPEPGKVPSGLFSTNLPYVRSSFKPNPVPVTPLMRCLLSGSSQGEPLAMQAVAAFPVTIQQIPPDAQNPQGGIYAHHEPLSFKVLKDIKQACTQYGTQSHYTIGLVEGLANTYRFIPWDWDMLTAAEFLQFKTWWTDEAAMRERRNRAQDPPVNITAEQLLGSGAWTGTERQLHYDDQAVNQVRQSCLAAWRRITAPGKPTQSLAKVIQGVNEPYVEFIARLTDMLTKTIEIPEARELILLTLTFDQANNECKKAIRPIKAAGGSVLDYIKACQDIGSTTHQMAVLASAMRGGNNPKKKGNCFKCGKFGHFQKNCRS